MGYVYLFVCMYVYGSYQSSNKIQLKGWHGSKKLTGTAEKNQGDTRRHGQGIKQQCKTEDGVELERLNRLGLIGMGNRCRWAWQEVGAGTDHGKVPGQRTGEEQQNPTQDS